MIFRRSLPATALLLLGCASNQKVPTIEPTPMPPTEASGAASPTATIEPTPQPPRRSRRAPAAAVVPVVAEGEDAGFVLSREPATHATGSPTGEVDWIHVAEKWWRFRAEFVKTSEDELKTRDDAITGDAPPTGFWDRQTAVETALVWTSLCNECHGGRRKIEDAMTMPTPAPTWGRGQGLFFGQRRAYKFLFDKVMNGGGPPKEDGKRPMPPWRGKLAREEIWALLYFLEFQSGGIEGRFPPSLYPRMPADFPAGQ